MRRVTKQMSTFNLGLLFGAPDNSPTYSQTTTPVESYEISTFKTVSGTLSNGQPAEPKTKQMVKAKRRMTERMSTFGFGWLFGTAESPTYSQTTSPVESYYVSTFKTKSVDSGDANRDDADTISSGSFTQEEMLESQSGSALSMSAKSGSQSGSEIVMSSDASSDVRSDDSRLAKFKALMSKMRKPPTPKTPPTNVEENLKMSKVVKDWAQNARMNGFIREQPVPLPPYSVHYGMNPRTPSRCRKVDNFVPNVDTTSIYDMQDVKTPKKIQNDAAVIHRLHLPKARPEDFVSPEELPEALYRNKV